MYRFFVLLFFLVYPFVTFADGIKWNVRPDFQSNKAAMEISGAICPGENKKKPENQWCYAVNDEDNRIQIFRLEGRTIVPGDRFWVLPERTVADKKTKEADLEAIAYHDGFVYATGSHGLSRKKNKLRPTQFYLFRFPTKKKKGKPDFDLPKDTVAPEIVKTNKLREIIQQADGLKEYAEKHLADKGANIEGIGIRSNAAYFGFRAPVEADGAIVLEVALDRLFGEGVQMPKTHHIHFGTGYGIRDMARLGNGFAILAGASIDGDLAPLIWYWIPGAEPKLLKALRVPAGSKAEAITILKVKKSKKFTALVFYDGKKNGAPEEFEMSFK